MYQEIKMQGRVAVIKRVGDETFIPLDSANRDYVEYLKWLEAGNTPLPAKELQ